LLKYSWFTMLCQSLLYSKVTQVYIHKYIFYIYIYIYIHILFNGLLYDIEYSSLYCTLGPCFSSILNVIVCIYQSQVSSPSLPLPLSPWQPYICSLRLWVCFHFVDKIHLCHSLDSTYKWYHMIFLSFFNINLF